MAMLFWSCNEDENTGVLSSSTLLVQESPWVFKTYELINILDIGNSILTEQQIANEITNELWGATLTFYENGSGFSDFPGEDDSEFTWQIINGNELQLDFTVDEFEDIEVYENLTVNSNELRISTNGSTYDTAIDFSVLHFGTLVFE